MRVSPMFEEVCARCLQFLFGALGVGHPEAFAIWAFLPRPSVLTSPTNLAIVLELSVWTTDAIFASYFHPAVLTRSTYATLRLPLSMRASSALCTELSHLAVATRTTNLA